MALVGENNRLNATFSKNKYNILCAALKYILRYSVMLCEIFGRSTYLNI